jgi:hypothetical protein
MLGCSKWARICCSCRNRATAEPAIQLELERVDGDFFVELIVVADGQIDWPHSAPAQRAHNPVRAHPPPRPRASGVSGSYPGLRDYGCQAAVGVPKRGQQFAAQLVIALLALVDEGVRSPGSTVAASSYNASCG